MYAVVRQWYKLLFFETLVITAFVEFLIEQWFENSFVFISKNFGHEHNGQTDQSTGVLSDQTIMMTGLNSKQNYPECLRRVKYYDAETKMTLVFLTNNQTLK